MKAIKLKKSWLRDPETLLRKLGAFKENQGFPDLVYISAQDYKILYKNTQKAYKKLYPNLNNKKIEFSVNMEMLGLGPNQALENAIKPGFVLMEETRVFQKQDSRSENGPS
jgi:hypothetical protein